MEKSGEFTEVRIRTGGTKGDTLLFLFVLAAVFVAYVIKNTLDKLALPGGVVAVALLAVLAFWLLRVRMVSYRYTVVDGKLVIEKITGKRSSVAAVLELHNTHVCGQNEQGKRMALTPNDKKAALCLKSGDCIYLIDASEALAERLKEDCCDRE